MSNPLKLERYVIGLHFSPNGGERHFHQVDYITETKLIGVRFHKKLAKVRGEVQSISYYATASCNSETGAVDCSDLILKEDFVYVRDSNKFALYRDQTITWYREDGTQHPETKLLRKYYDFGTPRICEGKRRRTNVMNELEQNVLVWAMMTETAGDYNAAEALAISLLASHKTNVDMYVVTQTAALADGVSADTTPWLDNTLDSGPPIVTVRDALIESITL